MITDIHNEDRLQAMFADHLRDVRGWESFHAYLFTRVLLLPSLMSVEIQV
jgi:hypothetical protein